MAHFKDKERTDYIIQNWLRSRSTIEYLGAWEQLNNPNFNPTEFDGIRKEKSLTQRRNEVDKEKKDILHYLKSKVQ